MFQANHRFDGFELWGRVIAEKQLLQKEKGKSQVYQCKVCQRKFKSRFERDSHLNSRHIRGRVRVGEQIKLVMKKSYKELFNHE